MKGSYICFYSKYWPSKSTHFGHLWCDERIPCQKQCLFFAAIRRAIFQFRDRHMSSGQESTVDAEGCPIQAISRCLHWFYYMSNHVSMSASLIRRQRCVLKILPASKFLIHKSPLTALDFRHSIQKWSSFVALKQHFTRDFFQIAWNLFTECSLPLLLHVCLFLKIHVMLLLIVNEIELGHHLITPVFLFLISRIRILVVYCLSHKITTFKLSNHVSNVLINWLWSPCFYQQTMTFNSIYLLMKKEKQRVPQMFVFKHETLHDHWTVKQRKILFD